MDNTFETFKKRISKKFFFKQFLLVKLPAAFFAGLKIASLSEHNAIVSVSYKWFTKNPFNSIYFAVLSMAAEMSTGVLAMGYIYNRKPSVSMLVTEQKSLFHKKATGKILFECIDGDKINTAVKDAIDSNNAISVTCYSKGLNSNNELVAECWITWSFKLRTNKAMPFTA